MEHYNEILNTIYDSIDELNSKSGPNESLGKTPDTVLIGAESPLDSVGIVSLVTAVEEGVERRFNVQVNVIDLVAVSDTVSWDADALARAIAKRISVRND